jgi:hypothetical protein
VPILGNGDTRYIVDFLHAGETVVYQIGCHTGGAGNILPTERPRNPVTTDCGLINPSFEQFVIVGRPLNWDFGDLSSRRDGRSFMLLDTRDPKHGRHALRVVVPTPTPLVLPIASASDVGLALVAGLTYNISFWARSTPAGMRLDLILRQAAGDVPDPGARTASALVGATLPEQWQQVSLVFVATAGSLQLRAKGAAGELFLDHFQASATKGGKAVACVAV